MGGIAVGINSGNANRQGNAVAIGTNAGNANQGASSIAIGPFAGENTAAANSILILADQVAGNTVGTGRTRPRASGVTGQLFYVSGAVLDNGLYVYGGARPLGI